MPRAARRRRIRPPADLAARRPGRPQAACGVVPAAPINAVEKAVDDHALVVPVPARLPGRPPAVCGVVPAAPVNAVDKAVDAHAAAVPVPARRPRRPPAARGVVAAAPVNAVEEPVDAHAAAVPDPARRPRHPPAARGVALAALGDAADVLPTRHRNRQSAARTANLDESGGNAARPVAVRPTGRPGRQPIPRIAPVNVPIAVNDASAAPIRRVRRREHQPAASIGTSFTAPSTQRNVRHASSASVERPTKRPRENLPRDNDDESGNSLSSEDDEPHFLLESSHMPLADSTNFHSNLRQDHCSDAINRLANILSDTLSQSLLNNSMNNRENMRRLPEFSRSPADWLHFKQAFKSIADSNQCDDTVMTNGFFER
ncbi:hypothetical protein QAD02_013198 [Eretmocerus hayati]|uniref:Uncharacterized protein n=1 Tax=Eretmocerus hayati TaxID=131215 RepID=A0ACC2P3M0_9HYME|nr:hypothetical protein QAD02_013198 [Eretmocerus hayati]